MLSIKDAEGNEVAGDFHIGKLDSLRYRGYYYDVETGLYYLNARYYDPATLRFLNADGIIDENNHSNLYSYCGNNPTVHYDPTGYEKKYTGIGGVGSGGSSFSGSGPTGRTYGRASVSSSYKINKTSPRVVSSSIKGAGNTVNNKGVTYPNVKVDSYGKVPFPSGPYTPNNSSSLRTSFSQSYKQQFKDWWISQGRTWPKGDNIQIHHIKPLSKGGTNSFQNLVPLPSQDHKPYTSWWRSYP